MNKVTKDMLISDVVALDPLNMSYILMDWGMHCVSCFAAAGETVEQAMYVHGYEEKDVDQLVDELNEFLETQMTDPSYLDDVFDKKKESDGSSAPVVAESNPDEENKTDDEN